MKNLSFNLSRMLLVFALGLVPYYSVAQDSKLSRQEKKELGQAAMQANFGAIDTLLDRKTFVLEADYLQDKYGYQVSVNSDINFIMVDSKKVVLQTGNNYNAGYNGVGGVTAEGNIQNFKMEKDFKNLSYTISFSVMTNVGIYDVLMNIHSDGKATATISGLFGGRLSWSGDFKNLYDTRAYKGQETYLR